MPPSTVDPRVARTHAHVLKTAHSMLSEGDEALTFTTIADRAQVSRRTLYVHWGSVENLIADTIVVISTGSDGDYEGLDATARSTLFLKRLAEEIEGGTAAAIAAMLASGFHDEASAVASAKLRETLYQLFVEKVGTVTREQFAELIGPILLIALTGSRAAPTLVASLAGRSRDFLNEG
jgi:AcrR family transcriptional regulator